MNQGIKNYSVGPWCVAKENMGVDGICPHCRKYHVELARDGYCKDQDCKRSRLEKALKEGNATRLDNGVILWHK